MVIKLTEEQLKQVEIERDILMRELDDDNLGGWDIVFLGDSIDELNEILEVGKARLTTKGLVY